ncbi:putative glycoside hydrolase family 5 protein [Neofusicoccum parvum]|uniref:Glycoside hydrolase family 5 protein n=1 Tax=Neofusicoccum parvum TaxID=310453 RepID=A0ACB5SNY0_9PEZI|nr:putative glycoside hydrolase family 5 protein [Neofusicoccum parvum]
MKFLTFLASALVALGGFHQASAAQSFSGSNLYYAAGLSTDQQNTLFTKLQSAGVKVLRVWLDGTQKGTPLNPYGPLQGDSPDDWDDTVLERLDSLMVNAHSYGIKLQVSLHSFNALESNADFYGKYYGTGDFYTNANAISQFQDRIKHVLSHVNPQTGKTWAASSEYIFAFETQNEAMNNDETKLRANGPKWQCTMASTIKTALGANDILVSTGGGGWVDTSLLDDYFSCAALDVLAIHAYGTGDLTAAKLQPFVDRAAAAGKKLLMQEWGACYWASANNACHSAAVLSDAERGGNVEDWAGVFGGVGLPWLYWQVLPNADPHDDWDYEIGVTDSLWGTFEKVAKAAEGYESPFDYSKYLL